MPDSVFNVIGNHFKEETEEFEKNLNQLNMSF